MASIKKPPSTATGANSEAVRSNFPQDALAYCVLQQILTFLGIGRSRYYVLMSQGKMPRPVIKNIKSPTWQAGAIRAAAEKLAQKGGA